MTEYQSPQDDFGQQGDAAAPGQTTGQSWPLPQADAQTEDAQYQDPQSQYGQQPNGQLQYQQVQPFVPQQMTPGARGPYVTGLTSAQNFWYTLQCIYFGLGYLAKIPAKKALEDYGMAQLTSTEQFWYTVECIFFGLGYFQKIPTAKALSEMPQFQAAGYR
jgi:hypothetical protein